MYMQKINRQFTFWCGLLAVFICLTGCVRGQDTNQSKHTTRLFAMGTYMTFTGYGKDAESALSRAAERVKELEALWSATDENSEIYKVNHSKGSPVTVSSETGELLRFTLDIAEQTGGALDPTIYPLMDTCGFVNGEYHIPAEQELASLLQGMSFEKVALRENTITLPEGVQLDLGAVGKGCAGAELSKLLKSQGITSALLDIGGNIQMIGARPDGAKWRLGIKHPLSEGTLGTVEAEDCAVVTSGKYERYFTGEDGRLYWHILDPTTGKPADSGLASVTIIAKDGKLCDALSTAVFVMGLEEGTEYWRSRDDFEMLLMTQQGEVYLTEGIEQDFTMNDSLSNKEVHVIER